MTRKKSNRGPEPTPLTIHMLCARASGRCQFEGCNEYLFKDMITLDEFNRSNVAHIVASNPDGPRGDIIRSHQLSDKIENLMLMCMSHHKMIDANPVKYCENMLIEMKQAHEKTISEQCGLIYKQPTELILFTSPIKGIIPVEISFNMAAEAVMPSKRLASMYGHKIMINLSAEYRSRDYWTEAGRQLIDGYNYTIKSIQSNKPDMHFSIFPIAPIPLIMKLGYIMGDKVQADVYQKTRMPDTWKWSASSITNRFNTKIISIRSGNQIALVLSLTADIAQERITEVFDADVIFAIQADRLGVDCISSSEDLAAFWHKYQETCDKIRNQHPEAQEIAVFPAMPVSAAFEVGRRFMPGVYPKLRIFDDDKGFFESLQIGE